MQHAQPSEQGNPRGTRTRFSGMKHAMPSTNGSLALPNFQYPTLAAYPYPMATAAVAGGSNGGVQNGMVDAAMMNGQHGTVFDLLCLVWDTVFNESVQVGRATQRPVRRSQVE